MPSIITCQPLVSHHQVNLFADLGMNLHNPPIIQTDLDDIFVSFNARSICNKLNEFNAFIDTVKPTYVAITETWLNDSVPDSLIDQRIFFKKNETIRMIVNIPYSGGIAQPEMVTPLEVVVFV